VALKVRPLPRLTRTLVAEVGGVTEAERVLDTVPLPAAVIAGHDRLVLRLEGWPDEVDEQEAAARTAAEWTLDEAPFPWPMFPDAPILAEAAVAPSRLDPLLEGRAPWRALAGVGTAWVPCESEHDLEALRSRAARLGGIAPALRGPGGLGHAELPGVEIHRRLKAAFDPADIMAPGRFWDFR
jgi:glycolate oxidase FAD binding subunit